MVLACALAAVTACEEVKVPPRPLVVPSTAAYAGGADGGAWIDCWRASDVEKQKDGLPHDELVDRFDCRVFTPRGAIEKNARFRLLDVGADKVLRPAADPRRVLQFEGWDGCAIHALPARVLVDEKALACTATNCTARC